MKTSYKCILALLSAAVVSACGENAVQKLITSAPTTEIKFFNFGVNAPGVDFYANDTKLTGINTTSGIDSTLGTVYGGAASGGFYSAVSPGQFAFVAKIAPTSNHVAISNLTATVVAGKQYSLYLSGFYNTTTKNIDSFIVEDPFPAQIDYTAAYVRFVNTISNSNPMTLYAKNTVTGVESAVGGEIAYKAAGVFTPLAGAVYDLNTRYTGSSTNVITRTAVSFSAGKVYTISARGDITVVSSTATNRPFLDNTANR
jgi:hypothetical protein